MKATDDSLRLRPGRIRHGNRGARRPETFIGEVTRAARKAGHLGTSFGASAAGRSRSRFGRGRQAALQIQLRTRARRVVIKARVVRHQGTRFRPAPMPKHLAYLKRDGVTRDGAPGRMFDATSDATDEQAFAERCAEDRHHFRFIISPEDAARLDDFRAFTRDLMRDAEHDLGTKLDWVAIDHWNTDNPHIHVLMRGRADDGQDLVISRAYISRGLHDRAAERLTLELGQRSEQEIRSTLDAEVSAERWTSLDRALRDLSDEGGGIVDLRAQSYGNDHDWRGLLLGRAAKLERLGLAEPVGSARWTLKPGLEPALRDLGARGDIIRTMHRALSGAGRAPDTADFAMHAAEPGEPVIGRLVERGFEDELKETAYAIIEGVDGRAHHLRLANVELTGDAKPGAIVETRAYEDASGRRTLSLATRSDLTLEEQVHASGPTWLDRQLLASSPAISNGGFGAEAREAMERRTDHFVAAGYARRQGQRVVFARDLLATLRERELAGVVERLSAETGLAHRPSAEGEHVAGIYRQRVTLASGRFALLDDGMGFQLVPWRPALEQHLGREVNGVMRASSVEWRFGRRRGIAL